jgi:hypothetical protein
MKPQPNDWPKPKLQLRRLALVVPLVVMAAFGNGCVGWGSSALPPRLSTAEEAKLKGAHLPLTVGVERYEAPGYSDGLVKALRRTGMFVSVEHLEQCTNPPALVARVERRIYGSTVIPLWTLLTFGIIPTNTEEETGYSFSFSSSVPAAQKLPVECAYKGRTMLGWIALFDGLQPDRILFPFDAENSRRFRDRLSLTILEHTEEIAAMAKK